MADDVPPVAESVLQKARLILAAFDAPSPQLGLSDLSRRTGLAKTTVHRVASELVSVGLLARYGRRYELAPLLFEFGQRVPRTRALRLAAFLTPRLARFAIPRFIRFVPELPTTENGKVRKTRLRDAAVTVDTWDRDKELFR